MITLSYRAFEGDGKEFLSLNGELHRQLLQHLLGIAVDDESNGLFSGDATLVAIEELVLRDFLGGCLVFEDGCIVMHVHIGEGMGTTIRTQQQ